MTAEADKGFYKGSGDNCFLGVTEPIGANRACSQNVAISEF